MGMRLFSAMFCCSRWEFIKRSEIRTASLSRFRRLILISILAPLEKRPFFVISALKSLTPHVSCLERTKKWRVIKFCFRNFDRALFHVLNRIFSATQSLTVSMKKIINHPLSITSHPFNSLIPLLNYRASIFQTGHEGAKRKLIKWNNGLETKFTPLGDNLHSCSDTLFFV